MADEDDFLRQMGFTDEEAAAIDARARAKLARGEKPDVRPVAEDGNPDADIAASRRRDLKER